MSYTQTTTPLLRDQLQLLISTHGRWGVFRSVIRALLTPTPPQFVAEVPNLPDDLFEDVGLPPKTDQRLPHWMIH